jgi:hypothetical protein
VTLQSEGASVAGTQNDITYSPGATIANSKKCLRTNATTCTADADCPLADPANASSAHEPCVVTPNCAVNAAGKEGFFSFLKTAGCTGTACDCTPGTDCTAIRAIVMSLNIEKPTAIADGATLYTCTFNAVTSAVALTNGNQGAGDPDGNALASVGGTNGMLTPAGTCSAAPPHCLGDSGDPGDGSIDASETVKTINAFAQDDVSIAPFSDGNCSDSIEASEVVQVINNFAQDACNPFQP